MSFEPWGGSLANRQNAQSSTGPRSPEGKAAASRNALKTGLYAAGIVIGYESTSALADLEAQFTARAPPITPTERSLVDTLIHSEWMLRRYRWLETEVWKAARKNLTDEQFEISAFGYSFIDEYGDEQIYWFPYEMILDGDTGAIEYVPLT